VFTLGRDGVTRLHDLNGDGEADFFECFNNDVMVTQNFHEFIFDLHTDPEGNFYFVKGGPVRPGGRGWTSGAASRLHVQGVPGRQQDGSGGPRLSRSERHVRRPERRTDLRR